MRFILISWSLAVLQLATLCTQAQVSEKVRYSPLRRIIPAKNLPKGVHTMRSNNNIDMIKFEGKYYVVFRTAPNHFPGKRAKLYVLSSNDMNTWQFEREIALGSDVREPRFLNFHDKLYLYFFQGGKTPFHFDPQHVYACQMNGPGKWDLTMLENLDGYVPWRIKYHNGKAYMSAYYGKGLYKSDHHADLRLFSSEDGFCYKPIAEEPQVKIHGAEEGEFEFDKKGNLWATVRLEGEGACIAYADKDSLGDWHLFPTDGKYDSALMFTHDDDIYVISRRNLDGSADKAPRWLPRGLRQKYNLINYSLTSKVTALYKLDKLKKKLDLVLDFPSTGDNSFPAIVSENDSSYMMLNYSSDIDGPQKVWFRGQLGKTYIYLTNLFFDKVIGKTQ